MGYREGDVGKTKGVLFINLNKTPFTQMVSPPQKANQHTRLPPFTGFSTVVTLMLPS